MKKDMLEGGTSIEKYKTFAVIKGEIGKLRLVTVGMEKEETKNERCFKGGMCH